MRGYVLTERGKLLIAMLVVIFLIVPSIIIVVYTSTRNTLPDESLNTSNGQHQGVPGTDTTEQNPEGTDETTPAVSNDNTGTVSPGSSLTGSATLDIDDGKMTFLFAPSLQTTLEDNTSSTIGQLLLSPKNTEDAKIAVEIPQLPDEDTAVLTTVILNAFITHDVSLSDIVFFVYQPESDEEPFEINISFK